MYAGHRLRRHHGEWYSHCLARIVERGSGWKCYFLRVAISEIPRLLIRTRLAAIFVDRHRKPPPLSFVLRRARRNVRQTPAGTNQRYRWGTVAQDGQASARPYHVPQAAGHRHRPPLRKMCVMGWWRWLPSLQVLSRPVLEDR